MNACEQDFDTNLGSIGRGPAGSTVADVPLAASSSDFASAAEGLAWRTYESWVRAEFSQLLERQPPEGEVQKFLEWNPSLLPGLSGSGPARPMGGVLYSQPQLRNVGKSRTPDFMWIEKNSMEWNPVLIEIEAPAKPWFTQAGKSTAHFTSAHGQLAEWKTWFSHEENKISFRERYLQWPESFPHLPLKPHYILIYGRRENWSEELIRRRSMLARDGEKLLSYDRLSPAYDLRNVITVKVDGKGQFRPVGVAPCLEIDADAGETSAKVGPITDLLKGLPLLSAERKSYLAVEWDLSAENE